MKRFGLILLIWLLVNLIGSLLLLLIVLPLYFKHPGKPPEFILSLESLLYVIGYSLVLSLPALVVYLIVISAENLPLSKFFRKSFYVITLLILISFLFLAPFGNSLLFGIIFFLPFSLTYFIATWIVIQFMRYYHFKIRKNVANIR